MQNQAIQIIGARQNNLKNLNLEDLCDTLTKITISIACLDEIIWASSWESSPRLDGAKSV